MLDWNLELPQEVQDFAPDLILVRADVTMWIQRSLVVVHRGTLMNEGCRHHAVMP